jgi:hypothetical protein
MRLYWLLGLLCVGCASAPRGMTSPLGGEPPKTETVYLVSFEEAMRVARNLLIERRYDVFEAENGTVLYTSAHEPGMNRKDTRAWERYYVKGERLGPRQTLIRVFRLRYEEFANGGGAALRDMGNREAEDYDKGNFSPFNRPLAGERFGAEPDPEGGGYLKSEFWAKSFAGAPAMEGFKLAHGYRDLEVEAKLLDRLERVPALEIVGGAAPAPTRAIVVNEAEGATTALPAECGEPLSGAEPLLARGLTLLLADPLGTRELPRATLQGLCDASAKGLPVVLGLSLPASEQALLDEYLASEGRPSDLEALLRRGAFWRREYQDGRGSRAILWLLEQARRLRASGRDVSLVAFDSDGASGNAREEEMARHVLAFRRKHPDAWMVALAGGIHARTGRVGWDSAFEPLGARLSRALPSVRALDVGFTRGSQFACRYNVWEQVECNVFAISPTDAALQGAEVANGVRLFAEPSPEGFHGRLYVGALSASPPVLQLGAGPGQPSAAPAR